MSKITYFQDTASFFTESKIHAKNATRNKKKLNFTGLPLSNIAVANPNTSNYRYVPIFETIEDEKKITKALSMLIEMESDYQQQYEPNITYISDGTDMPIIKNKFIPVMEKFLDIPNLTSGDYTISVIIGKGYNNSPILHYDRGTIAAMLLAVEGDGTLHASKTQSEEIRQSKLEPDRYAKENPSILQRLTKTPKGVALVMTGKLHSGGGLAHMPPPYDARYPNRMFLSLAVAKK